MDARSKPKSTEMSCSGEKLPIIREKLAENCRSGDSEESGSEYGDLELVITRTREIGSHDSDFSEGEPSDNEESSKIVPPTSPVAVFPDVNGESI